MLTIYRLENFNAVFIAFMGVMIYLCNISLHIIWFAGGVIDSISFVISNLKKIRHDE